MGWHKAGTPAGTLLTDEGGPSWICPWYFAQADCFVCGNPIDPDEAWVFWHGINAMNGGLAEELTPSDANVVIIHPDCATHIACSLIKDALLAKGKNVTDINGRS